MLILLLAACRDNAPAATPLPSNTPQPSATPTPRSTPLPPVPTPVLLGTEEQPLQLAFVREGSTSINRVLGDLGEAISDETDNFNLGLYDGLSVEVILLEERAAALDLLCGSQNSAVFVDFFTYIAAERRCGAIPTLRVEQEDSEGSSFEIVIRNDRIGSLRQLMRADSSQRNFNICLMSREDFSSFVHPEMAFQALAQHPDIDAISPTISLLNPETITVVTETEEGEPFADELEMLRQMEGGGSQRRCESAILPLGRFAEIVAELEDDEEADPLPDTLQVFAVSEGNFAVTDDLDEAVQDLWQPIPYEVLVFPPESLYPAYLREELMRVLTVAEEEENEISRDLGLLLDYERLEPVEAEDYAEVRAWLEAAGWNMAASAAN